MDKPKKKKNKYIYIHFFIVPFVFFIVKWDHSLLLFPFYLFGDRNHECKALSENKIT